MGNNMLAEKTLTDKVSRNFSSIKLKKTSVKIPKVKAAKEKAVRRNKREYGSEINISSLINILVKSPSQEDKKGKKEKSEVQEGKGYAILKEEMPVVNGGYGTISRSYGSAPHSSYVDYGKLFSYLGKFRARSAFENFADDGPAERINRMIEEGNKFYLVDRETMDNGVRSLKYFTSGVILGDLGAVPSGGINSGDWEKFKLWKLVDYVTFNLKMSTL